MSSDRRHMFVFILALVAAMGFFALATIARGATPEERDRLIERMVVVESHNDSRAEGDECTALGVLQIRMIMILEANRIAGTSYTEEDVVDPVTSRAVARIVLSYYDHHILASTGRAATIQELAFVWNAGGHAWIRASHPRNDDLQRHLDHYWLKVQHVR